MPNGKKKTHRAEATVGHHVRVQSVGSIRLIFSTYYIHGGWRKNTFPPLASFLTRNGTMGGDSFRPVCDQAVGKSNDVLPSNITRYSQKAAFLFARTNPSRTNKKAQYFVVILTICFLRRLTNLTDNINVVF